MTTLMAAATDTAKAKKEILGGIEWPEAVHLAELLDVSIGRLAEILRISPATMQRRNSAGRFSLEESERIIRYARLWHLATLALGSLDGARSWLKRSQHGLGGRIPLDEAQLEIGARLVETLLNRIHYGVLA